MATIRNPLFSIAASGTIARVLTIRTAQTRVVASLPMRPTGEPSAAQAACRLRASWAASTWAGLDGPSRQEWQTKATARDMPVFGLYLKEFCAQRCTLTRAPLPPA